MLVFLWYFHRKETLDELEDGAKQLMESLREDIIQIERELTEGWLGSVPDFEEWEKKAQEVSLKKEKIFICIHIMLFAPILLQGSGISTLQLKLLIIRIFIF